VKTREVCNSDDVIDSREVISRIAELEDNAEAWKNDPASVDTDELAELLTLQKLASECEGYGDWQHGETLIRGSYFKDYAMELAEDIGALPKDATWPNTCIDWDQAARELKYDYMCVDFDGVEYWMRSA